MAFNRSLLVAAVISAVSLPAFAGSHEGNPAVAARQAHMNLYAHNLYYLLGVARGRADYDADLAQAAADSIVALTTVSQRRYWAPGTDSDSEASSRAKPGLWENFPTVMGYAGDVNEAAAALKSVAGNGLEAMAPAAAALNDACNACHKDFRASSN